MQNAVDHAFPRGAEGLAEGHVRVELAREADELVVDVVDDGVGLPPGFSLDDGKGLGLSIVHALVTSELSGSIELRDDHGTRVHLRIPLRQAERVEL
jgi:two-component sensor histidine kinase